MPFPQKNVICTVSLCGFVYWISRYILWRKLEFLSKSCKLKNKFRNYFLVWLYLSSVAKRTFKMVKRCHLFYIKKFLYLFLLLWNIRLGPGVCNYTLLTIKTKYFITVWIWYNVCLEKGLNQLIVTIHI